MRDGKDPLDLDGEDFNNDVRGLDFLDNRSLGRALLLL